MSYVISHCQGILGWAECQVQWVLIFLALVHQLRSRKSAVFLTEHLAVLLMITGLVLVRELGFVVMVEQLCL